MLDAQLRQHFLKLSTAPMPTVRAHNIHVLAHWYVEEIYSTNEKLAFMEEQRIAKECQDPVIGEKQLKFYCDTLYNRTNELLRCYITNNFTFSAQGPNFQKHVDDTNDDINDTLDFRRELIALYAILGVKVDRSKDVMLPVALPNFYFNRKPS